MSLVRGECVSPVSFALPARDGQVAVAAPTLGFQELSAWLSFSKGNGKLSAVCSSGFSAETLVVGTGVEKQTSCTLLCTSSASAPIQTEKLLIRFPRWRRTSQSCSYR